MYFPKLATEGTSAEVVVGARVGRDFDALRARAEAHIRMIEQNQRSRTPFDNEWSRQRIADVHSALESVLMITTGRRDPIQLRNIVLEPDSYATIFLFLDRPATRRSVVRADRRHSARSARRAGDWRHERACRIRAGTGAATAAPQADGAANRVDWRIRESARALAWRGHSARRIGVGAASPGPMVVRSP